MPQLAEGATSVEVEESQVDVSHDPRRFIRDRDEPFYVSGIRATYFVPYIGDGDLFKCQPSTFTTVIPAVTDLLQDELVFAVERPDQNVAATKQACEGELSRVKEYLAWVRRDCGARRIEIRWLERGNTRGDAVVVLQPGIERARRQVRGEPDK